jgi:hypothetical protein
LAATARHAARFRNWVDLTPQKMKDTTTLPTQAHRQTLLNSVFILEPRFEDHRPASSRPSQTIYGI